MGDQPETGAMGRTSIQISTKLADELHNRKQRGDSYEDVLWRYIDAENELRKYMTEHDLTYDEAIMELLKDTGWSNE